VGFIVRKINILFFLAVVIIKNTAAECFINNEDNPKINSLFKVETSVRSKNFHLNQVDDKWIVDNEIDFFVWKVNDTYFFSKYITYSGIGYTREMIVNSLFICSVNEMKYVLSKNRNHRVSVFLIRNPMNKEFLIRNNALMASRFDYIDFIVYYLVESVKNDVMIEILDSWNASWIAKKMIK
jgi:hypothetical protein